MRWLFIAAAEVGDSVYKSGMYIEHSRAMMNSLIFSLKCMSHHLRILMLSHSVLRVLEMSTSFAMSRLMLTFCKRKRK
jgi:hypothetical protein